MFVNFYWFQMIDTVIDTVYIWYLPVFTTISSTHLTVLVKIHKYFSNIIKHSPKTISSVKLSAFTKEI